MSDIIENLERDAKLCDYNGYNLAAKNYRASIAEITKLRAELEAERGKVAMQEEALNILARLGNGDKFGNSHGNCIAIDVLSNTPSAWLATRDARIRDDVLEEVADYFECCPRLDAFGIRDEIRAMKGKP